MTLTTYMNYELDPFQRQAIDLITQGRSVIVSAPTGVGKTLVADFLVEQIISQGQKVVYTAPIKALSNQKYKEFKQRFGEERVGIVTGDINVNPRADCLIMTTEIFRNMVLAQEPFVQDVSYIIFDEIHYIDSERGVAWEESVIFAPPHIRVLGLSATIGNLDQLAAWLSEVRQEEFAIVVETRRVVPLDHYYFMLDEAGKQAVVPCGKLELVAKPERGQIDHLDLIKYLRSRHLPALFFVFSRRQCSEKARDSAQAFQLLTRQELGEVEETIARFSAVTGIASSGDFRVLRTVLRRGVGYHHAGLLPILKDMVEELFGQKLIKMLYCTETFSVGINYPVRSVCFDGQRKYDGKNVRPLKAQEYYQMAGRAGRRGMDESGSVFTLVTNTQGRLENYADKPLERLNSQFRLTFNSVLNLLKYVSPEHRSRILTQSFASFLSSRDRRIFEARYNEVLSEKCELEEYVCDQINEIWCPVTHLQKTHKLRSYENLLKRSRYRDAALRVKHSELKLSLDETSTKQCPPNKRTNCSKLKKRYNQMLYHLNLVKDELNKIPSRDTHIDAFERKVTILERLQYVEGGELLPRGDMAAQIYIQELLITDLVFAGMLEELSEAEIVALLLGVDYPWRKFDTVLPVESLKLQKWFSFINRLRIDRAIAAEIVYTSYLAPIGYLWANGEELRFILDQCNLDEGDIVALLRREIDLLRQMRHALKDVPHLAEKITRCMNLIDRDLVRVEL